MSDDDLLRAYCEVLGLPQTASRYEVDAAFLLMDDSESRATVKRVTGFLIPEHWERVVAVAVDLDGPPNPDYDPIVNIVAVAACRREIEGQFARYARRWVVQAMASEVPAVEAVLRALAAGDPEPARRYVWDRIGDPEDGES